jgi:transposase
MSNENSLREIASELDVSVASAKARLYRARTQIAQSHPFRGRKSKLRVSKQNQEKRCQEQNGAA